jgi:T5SS/PEP-CTERM-associated repeat protein
MGSLALMAGLTLLAGRASAQYTWIATTSSNWNNAANWDVNGVPMPGTTTTLTFGDGGYIATNDIGMTPFQLNSMTFNNTGTGVNGVTIAGSDSIANGLNFVGTNATITRGAGDVNITSAITLGTNLTTAGGAGTLTFGNTVSDGGGGFNVIKTGTGPLVFAAGGSFNLLSIQNGAVNATGGTLALTQPDPGTRLPGLQIGAASGQTGSFTASGGAQINVTENVYIGDAAGSNGTMTLTGSGTAMNTNIGGASGRFAVGNFGNGTLSILNGATLTTRFLLTNRSGGTSGSILVDGAGSTLTAKTVGSNTGQVTISSAAGSTGTLTVQNQGTVNVTGVLLSAAAAGSTGTTTVQSGGTVNVTGTFFSATAAGSTGTTTVQTGGTVSVSGAFLSGQNGAGTTTVTGVGSSMSVGAQLEVGVNPGSVGVLNIKSGATITNAGSTFIGIGGASGTAPASSGTFNVDGVGSSFVQSGSATTSVVVVGGGAAPGGVGTLNITNGAAVSATGQPQIGASAGATGTLNILSGSTFTTASSVFAGPVGGSAGTVNVSGVGSSFTQNGPVATSGVVFGGGTTPGGTGNLNVTSGATFTAANPTFALNIGSTSTAIIDASTMNAVGDLAIGFGVNATPPVAGTAKGTMTVQNGSTVNITGGAAAELDVGILAGGIGTLTIQSGSTMTLGGSGFVGESPAIVGSPAFPAAVGTLNISGPGSILTMPVAGTALVIGGGNGGGTGTLNVTNGAIVTVPILTLGNDSTSTGTAVVSDATLNVTTELDLGNGGNATLSILNAGSVFVGGNTFAGPTATITGAITLTGIKSSLTVLGNAILGGNNGLPAGTGSITANAGSTVDLGPTALFAGGSITANGGPLGSFTVGGLSDGVAGANPSIGTVAVGSGSAFTINTNGINFQFDGVISGAGSVTKTGLGTQFLTGSNTYTGPTAINGGVLGFTAAANLGAGTAITFNGGILQFVNPTGGTNTTDISARTVTILAGGATIDTVANNMTFANSIGNNGNGALTKLGTGTLTLTPAATGGATVGFNTYRGGTNVLNGSVSVSSDAALGVVNVGTVAAPVLVPLGNVTGAAAGTLLFTQPSPAAPIATSRSFAMNGGTISVVAGQTVTFSAANGGQVSGATLDGAGTFATDATAGAQFVGVTSSPSAIVASNSGADQFIHFTNGAAGTFNSDGSLNTAGLTVAPGINTANNATSSTPVTFNGFTNQGSGSITIGAGSRIKVANFQSSGQLILNPATPGQSPIQFTELINTGSSAMFFNGGSRTFIGTPATAMASPPLAGVDLHGQNLVIAGGLFVNNGFVTDSTTPKGSIIVDFGALYKGAGTSFVPVITQNGGKVQAGNSPGSAGFGTFVFGPGGVSNYVFAIDNATGVAGPSPDAAGLVSGWGLVKAVKESFLGTTSSGDFVWSADATHKVSVSIDTLVNPTTVGTDVPGMMANFNPNMPYSWQAAQWAGTYSGPTDAATLNADTAFDTSGVLNPVAGTFGWSIDPSGQSLSLIYTPTAVPEPGTLALTALAGLGLARSIRRRYFGATIRGS